LPTVTRRPYKTFWQIIPSLDREVTVNRAKSNFSKVVYNQIQDQGIKHLVEQDILITNLLTAIFKSGNHKVNASKDTTQGLIVNVSITCHRLVDPPDAVLS